jgi:hypothetical protein
MAQTLARHSDVRLTLGVYTHVGLHDQTVAIAALPPPPGGKGTETEAAELRATGTEGRSCEHQMVPPAVPSGAQIGAHVVAPKRLRISLGCTEAADEPNENGDRKIAVRSNGNRRYRTSQHQSASPCTAPRDGSMKVSPARLELATFGSGGHFLYSRTVCRRCLLFNKLRHKTSSLPTCQLFHILHVLRRIINNSVSDSVPSGSLLLLQFFRIFSAFIAL